MNSRRVIIALVAVLSIVGGFTIPAAAQQFSLDLGEAGSGVFTGRLFQLVVLITVISLAPSLLVVVTSFTRIVIVLSLMRSAIGVQQTPPNAVLTSTLISDASGRSRSSSAGSSNGSSVGKDPEPNSMAADGSIGSAPSIPGYPDRLEAGGRVNSSRSSTGW